MLANQTYSELASEDLGDERRASTRYPCALDTSCQAIAQASADTWPVRVLDLSAGGAALAIFRRFEPGTVLSLRLESPDGSLARTVLLRVVHTSPEVDGSWRLGCMLAGELGEEELGAFRAERRRPTEPDCRAWVRFACDVQTACRPANSPESESWSARVLDVSPAGLSLLVPYSFEVGALLSVELPRSAPDGKRQVLVRVIRERALGLHLWLLGCELADRLTDDDLQRFQ